MESSLVEVRCPRGDTVPAALAALGAGQPVLVVDARRSSDKGRSTAKEGVVVLAGALAEPRWTAWTVRHSSGLLYAPLFGERAEALELPRMTRRSAGGDVFTVSVDATQGVGTGISASDRSHTARVLADPMSQPADLTRPGHVLPLRAAAGGVLERSGHAEAAVDLCQLAGLPAVALAAEVVGDDGVLARRAAVLELGRWSQLPVLELAALESHRLYHGDGLRQRVTHGATASLPTGHGPMRAVGYRDEVTSAEHVALLAGPPPGSVPLVATHIECLAGEVFGSLRCDCAGRLDAALARVAAEGGVVVYVRRTGTRHLTDAGGADAHAHSRADAAAAAAVLADLGLSTVRLLRGPITAAELAPGGIAVVATVAGPLGGTRVPADCAPRLETR
jgi:3,4-dihydroxy 2-butanone 4-phosphate synthase/GTP cyclohydrolase II